MFSSNLKYYRLRSELSMKKLAEQCGITAMAVSNYENGKRMPDMGTMKKMALALHVRVTDFLAAQDESLSFVHGEFRKNSRLSKMQQDYIRGYVEEYSNRFMQIVDILGGKVLPDFPIPHQLTLTGDVESNAANLREYLGLPRKGPVQNLIGTLENQGLIMIAISYSGRFSGMNGLINGRPYIIYNDSMSPERCRSTIAHELVHLMFQWPDNISEKEGEEQARAVSGAFLLPAEDIKRELGIYRTAVTRDMEMTAKEYGVSMMMLATRAKIVHVISENAARNFYIRASQYGWRVSEPSRIEAEKPTLFDQLVFRAVTENEISLQKASELLKKSIVEIRQKCYGDTIWENRSVNDEGKGADIV